MADFNNLINSYFVIRLGTCNKYNFHQFEYHDVREIKPNFYLHVN